MRLVVLLSLTQGPRSKLERSLREGIDVNFFCLLLQRQKVFRLHCVVVVEHRKSCLLLLQERKAQEKDRSLALASSVYVWACGLL